MTPGITRAAAVTSASPGSLTPVMEHRDPQTGSAR
jgi:hypothetical protein